MTPVELLTNLVLFVNKIKTELKTVVKSPLKIKGEGLKTQIVVSDLFDLLRRESLLHPPLKRESGTPPRRRAGLLSGVLSLHKRLPPRLQKTS